jgi:hypothetical protein
MLVICDGRGERFEECLHACAVRVRQYEREGVVGARLDGGVDVGRDIALIEQARRPLAALPPDVADAPLLSDARLVLKIQAKPLALMCIGNLSERAQGSF